MKKAASRRALSTRSQGKASEQDDKKLLTKDELLEERLRFSETDPHYRTAIRIAPEIWSFRELTEWGVVSEANQLSKLGKWLLAATPKDLRALADVIDRGATDWRIDGRRANIVQSWCAAVYLKKRVPTLAEVKECFLSYFDQQSLPKNYSIRKTLKILGLEIGKDKLGRRPRKGPKKRRRRSRYSIKTFAILKL